jgi:hypothetical protein
MQLVMVFGTLLRLLLNFQQRGDSDLASVTVPFNKKLTNYKTLHKALIFEIPHNNEMLWLN